MVIKENLETSNRLNFSIDKATKFIVGSRNPDGFWSDFLTLAGESTYWVSGYVGYSLLCYCKGKEQESLLKQVGQDLLAHQNPAGGWGYGIGVPADADSTSWCLRFLAKLGIQSQESRDQALLFLLKHQNGFDGGFRTYANPNGVARYMMLNENVSFEGWISSQMCVTAVAAQALIENDSAKGVKEAIAHIRKGQVVEGYWNPYWWSSKLYATFNCMEALRAGGDGEDKDLLSNAQKWIARTQLASGGWSESPTPDAGWPFSTALALRSLMVTYNPNYSQNIRLAVDWLLNHQLDDGSWEYNHILRIPHPSMKEPWNQSCWKTDGKAINAVIKDQRRLYTTATVFAALSEFENSSSRGKIE
jgi:squalene cyclase